VTTEHSEAEESEDLLDGRDLGDWKTRWSREAWIQILCELAFLFLLLGTGLSIVFFCVIAGTTDDGKFLTFGKDDRLILLWIATAGSGLVGGCVFALKWHYHCVAKGNWNSDRFVWRITSPIISAVLAIFTAMIIRSEIIPLLKGKELDNFPTLISLGFIFGLFSDNLLASLQNFANKTFGTLKAKDDE